MKNARLTGFIVTCLLTSAAWAQNAGQPLNLKLPANLPASSASTAAPAADSKTAAASAPSAPANAADPHAKDPPGTYYGDTSGAPGDAMGADGKPVVSCDDATYNQPQMHGAVSTGVVSGKHVSGSYGAAGVTLSQAFGSCEHPSGGMSISVSGSKGHFGR